MNGRIGLANELFAFCVAYIPSYGAYEYAKLAMLVICPK